MKYLQRYFSLLCVLVLLFTAFSITASAEELDIKDYHIAVGGYYNNEWNWNTTNLSGWNLTLYPNDDTVQKNTQTITNGVIANTTYLFVYQNFYTEFIDGSAMAHKDRELEFTLYNAYHSVYLVNSGDFSYYERTIDTCRALIYYVNGEQEYIDNCEVSSNGALHNLSVKFTPKHDVKGIQFHIRNNITLDKAYTDHTAFTVYIGEEGESTWSISLNQSSEEAGLLSGIIEWLKGIKDGITKLFDSIGELPSKIWGFIENGLKALFMPSEDFIVQFKADTEEMLSNKLGAVWQVIDITLESWDSITANDTADTINIPETTIPLPEGASFSFGGYDVNIVPSGFEFIVTIIKTVVGIVCTILFINGLRKKYDEVMGVEQ